MECELIVPEIARTHASSDDKEVEREPALTEPGAGHFHHPGPELDVGNISQHNVEVRLLSLELADRRRNFGRREHRGGDLIQQWLKNMMIAPIDQDDLDIGPPERSRRGNSRKPAAEITTHCLRGAGTTTAGFSAVKPSVRPELIDIPTIPESEPRCD
jgi:hypothetical protein